MAKLEKKKLRAAFRDAVFDRDGYRCVVCGEGSSKLDAHHITDRNEMPNGGFCPANGILLCEECHQKAEVFHISGEASVGFAPDDLYVKIGSSHKEALIESEKLSKQN